MYYAVYVEFLMAFPDRWERLDEFRDSEDAMKYIDKRQPLTMLTYRIVRHDGIILMKCPPKLLES